MKKQFKKYPRYTADNQPFRYYKSDDGIAVTEVSRAHFLDLVCSVPKSDGHVFLDRESGLAIFFVDINGINELLEFSRRDFNREAKRQERAHQCVMRGTKQCDGWIPDENGFVRCVTCARRNTARTISLDVPINADENGEPIYMGIPSEDAALARLFEEADRTVLQDALETLSDDDREYLTARFQPGMTARELAKEYNIADHRYANRKAQRIVDRVIRRIREIEK